MCTHTTTHHTPCLCISTRTTAPCAEAVGAGYRGSMCRAFEHVQLFISADDPARCFRHPDGGSNDRNGGEEDKGGGEKLASTPNRKASLKDVVRAGKVKELVMKIDRRNAQEVVMKIDEACGQEDIKERIDETTGQEVISTKIDGTSGQEETARRLDGGSCQGDTARKLDGLGIQRVMTGETDHTTGQDDKVTKTDTENGHNSMVEQHIEDLIDEFNRLSPEPLKLTKQKAAKEDQSPQNYPHQPHRSTNDKNTGLGDSTGADTARRITIYSESDYYHHDSGSDCSLVDANSPTTKQSHFSILSYSSSTDPFNFSTPSSPNTSSPVTPQTSFSEDDGVIYGGTSLLHVPIDGTKWNWNGTQWIGTRASSAVFIRDEEELAGIILHRNL